MVMPRGQGGAMPAPGEAPPDTRKRIVGEGYQYGNGTVIAPGTTHENMSGNFLENPYGGVDLRNYTYGRTPTGADDAVARTTQIANVGGQYGAEAVGAGNAATAQGNALLGQRTGDAAYFNARQTGNPQAQQLAQLEAQQGPSAAQGMLQQGTNQALNSQLALARSGRGLGGNAAAMGQAQGNVAGIQANQATSASQLAAQENAAWRQRQAANLGASAGIQLNSQGQNDAATMQSLGLGQQAWNAGLGFQQQGYGQGLQGANIGLQGQGVNNQTRQIEMTGGTQQEDNMLRQWAAQNGYTLAGQQAEDQKTAAGISAGATILGAMVSDVRAKKDITRSDEPAISFARGTMPNTQQPDTAALDAVANSPGYGYKYIDPSAPGAKGGENYGPMAQDLAATPAGATAVVKGPDGKLGIDPGRLSLLNTSAVSAQQRQLDELQKQIQSFSQQPGAVYPTTQTGPYPSQGSF